MDGVVSSWPNVETGAFPEDREAHQKKPNRKMMPSMGKR